MSIALRVLRSLPAGVLAAAAVDAVCVRLRLPWRSLGPGLYLESVLLWGALGLLATLPAALTLGLARRKDAEAPGAGRVAATLLGWMTLPVAVHATLDHYVGLEAELSGLREPGPWLRVLLVLAVGCLLLFGLAHLTRRVGAGRLALASMALAALGGSFLPPRPRPVGARDPGLADSRPNLLLLVWDTTRADRLVPYGYGRDTTPHLARFAEESVVFENATSAATFTFSSHLSMLAGVYPSTHGARLLSTRYDPRRATTIAETLRKSGYRTGAFVGTDVLAGRTGIRHGFECYADRVDPKVCDTFAWGLLHDVQAVLAELVPALRGNGNPHWFQDFQRPASSVLAEALDWIGEDDGRPWFALVNLYDVHWPYVPRADGRALVSPYDGPLDGYLFRSDAWVPGTEWTERDAGHVGELYDGELLELDQAVDAFLSALRLEDGRTAVVMTSDHGEAFGEQGQWKHEDVGEPQVRIPLIVRPAATAPTGRRVAARVTNVDVAPTLLALAGLEAPESTEGFDLLAEHLEPERVVFVEDRDHLDPLDVRIALYRGSWKLVRRGLGPEARFTLFDLAADPRGRRDVAAEHPDLLAELTELLEQHRRERDAVDAEVQGPDPSAAAGLQALGYTGGEEDREAVE